MKSKKKIETATLWYSFVDKTKTGFIVHFNKNNNNNNWPTHTLQQLPMKLGQQQKRQPLVKRRNIQTSRVIIFFSQLPLSHWVQSMPRVASSFWNSVASLLISRATTEKSAFYFSDSSFWFSGTMPSYCMTVLWRRRRSKVHSSLIFVLFVLHSVIFSFPGNWVPGSKNNNNNSNKPIISKKPHSPVSGN